jgi:sulfate permease, SulP family
MVVTTTTAAALAAGSALGGFSGADRPEALFVVSALVGVIVILAGVWRWRRFTRFVSMSVLTGFLAEVAETILQSTQTARRRAVARHLRGIAPVDAP